MVAKLLAKMSTTKTVGKGFVAVDDVLLLPSSNS